MRAGWFPAVAAGIIVGAAAPAIAESQVVTASRERQQQQDVRREREPGRDRADDRRQAERARERRQEQAANARGLVLVQRKDDRYRDNDRRYDNRRDNRYDRNDRYDRYDPRLVYNRGVVIGYDRNGPVFCRTGEGHPRYGGQWCRDRGYGLGNERHRDIWGDIQFRNNRYDSRLLSHSMLEGILGGTMLNHFDSYGRTYYGTGPLCGRWLDNRATVLQLYMGSVPIARLVDINRDGRVDTVSLLR